MRSKSIVRGRPETPFCCGWGGSLHEARAALRGRSQTLMWATQPRKSEAQMEKVPACSDARLPVSRPVASGKDQPARSPASASESAVATPDGRPQASKHKCRWALDGHSARHRWCLRRSWRL